LFPADKVEHGLALLLPFRVLEGLVWRTLYGDRDRLAVQIAGFQVLAREHVIAFHFEVLSVHCRGKSARRTTRRWGGSRRALRAQCRGIPRAASPRSRRAFPARADGAPEC